MWPLEKKNVEKYKTLCLKNYTILLKPDSNNWVRRISVKCFCLDRIKLIIIDKCLMLQKWFRAERNFLKVITL